ncbi:Gfo/Idh/MocA family oxidoreductase [soil metagenome]
MLNLAVVGLGYWGPNLARNISVSTRASLSALCDTDERRVAKVTRQHPGTRGTTDYESILADPEISGIAVATPVSTHHALARQALEAGKHVLVEKPLAATSSQAEDLLALASDRGLMLLVDHVFLYSSPVRKLLEIYRSGELGELNFVDSVRINLGLVQNDVNVLWDLAPHDRSIIDGLLQTTPQTVAAIGRSHVANGNVDVSYLHLDYDGVTAAVHLNWLSPVKIRHLMVGGSRKSVLYNDLDTAEPVKVYDSGVDVSDDPGRRRGLLVSYRSGDVHSPRVDTREPLSTLIDHFVDCVRYGVPPISGGEQGLRIVRILEAADHSLAAGGTPTKVGT